MVLENENITLTYERFVPTEEEVREIEVAVGRMLEACPYDSSAECSIHNLGDRYAVEIVVRHLLGQFRALGEEETLGAAVESALSSAYQSLEYWHHDRFRDLDEAPPKTRVLLVDDDPISIKILESCLRKQGCRTTVASTYEQAIADIEHAEYDLVVMDWNMPDHDGRETLLAMDKSIAKLNKKLPSKIPVVTYSISDKEKIRFPRMSHLRQLGHLRKATPLRLLKGATKGFLKQLGSGTLDA